MPPKRKKTTPNMMASDKKSTWKRKTVPPPSLSAAPPVKEEEEEEDDDGSPVACVNVIDDMARFEETEDCFILGFNPDEPVPPPPPVPPARPELPDLNDPPPDDPPPTLPNHQDVDLTVIAEKGQVACRDYPHSRHQCVKFPFETTPHEEHCELCYCFVCDSAAPCSFWTNERNSHCNAQDVGHWKTQRELKRRCKSKKK